MMPKFKLPDLARMKVPAAALALGIALGLGGGYFMVQKEKGIAQDKIKEATRKIAFLQKKLTDEKNETIMGIEQKCQSETDQLRKEKSALEAQVSQMKTRTHTLEEQYRQADASLQKYKKDYQETEKKMADAVKHNRELERDLKKTTGEKQALQSELKKTGLVLGRCVTNNARLCVIAEELVNSYRGKGPLSALLEREPLTQFKKVELEKLVQTYREEIEQQKLKKK